VGGQGTLLASGCARMCIGVSVCMHVGNQELLMTRWACMRAPRMLLAALGRVLPV